MESSLWGAVIRIMVCLPIVAIMAYLLIKYGLARNYSRSRSNLRVLEQLELMPKSKLCVVQVGAECLLLGVTEKDMVMLKKLDDYREHSEATEPGTAGGLIRDRNTGTQHFYETYLQDLRDRRSAVHCKSQLARKDRNYGPGPAKNTRDKDFQDCLQRLTRRSEGNA